MASKASLDSRGVERGRCNIAHCGCLAFSLGTGGDVKCQTCQHPPTKHENLTKSGQLNTNITGYNTSAAGIAGYTATTSGLGACDSGHSRLYSSVATHGSADHTQYSTEHLTRKALHPQSSYPYNTSSYTPHTYYHSSHYYPPQPKCKASDCNETVFSDPILGEFNYCSPQCRDQHALPEYNQKLDIDIAKFEATLHKLNPYIETVELEKKSNAPLGVLFALDGDKVLICGVKLKKGQKQLPLLANVEQICGSPPPIDLKKIETFTAPKTKIVLKLNCKDSVEADLTYFFGTAKAKNATHIFALNDFGHEYNFKVAKMKPFVVQEVYERARKTMNGLEKSDRIICYTSYKDGWLFETATPTDQTHSDLLYAASQGHVLLVAISRK